jgi:hypothetical protein
MTTAKKTAAKKTAAKKTAAKKTAATKPAAKKTAAKKTASELPASPVDDDVDIDDIDLEIEIDLDDIDVDIDVDIDIEADVLPVAPDTDGSEDALDGAEELGEEDDLDDLLQEEDGADDADVVRERAASTALVAGFDDERVPVKPRPGTVDDEDDDVDLAVVVERRSFEFVCQSCFLVMRRTQIGQSEPVELCKDCC